MIDKGQRFPFPTKTYQFKVALTADHDRWYWIYEDGVCFDSAKRAAERRISLGLHRKIISGRIWPIGRGRPDYDTEMTK